MGSVFAPLDWVTLGFYFTIVLGLGLWVTLRSKDQADDYFLAGRSLGWFLVGASIFASNIGSEHVVGLAGSGATDGVAMAHYELHAWCLLVLGWVFVPFYIRSKIFTMPEFLEKRFNPGARMVLSFFSIMGYVLTKIAVSIYAGGVVFSALMPNVHIGNPAPGHFYMDSFWIGSIAVIVLTGAYTVMGGMRAVVYTEAIQVCVLIGGSITVTVLGLKALGGWHVLRDTLGSDAFNLWKPIVRAGAEGTWAPVRQMAADGKTIVKEAWYFNTNYPWFSMLICAPVIGLWYWCTCQYIVQRALGAPNQTEARRGTIFASYLKLLPVFLFIIPGMICFALAKKHYGGLGALVGPGGAVDRDTAQRAFPMLVEAVLPPGIRGLVVAGLLAALMSSLAGVFNASATLFTIDFYTRYKPKASQSQLVWIGRVTTVVLVLIALAWIPVIKGGKGLYDYLQGVQAYLAPPIFVVFFLGVFVKRMNGPGAFWSLIVGFAMGLFRLTVDTMANPMLPASWRMTYPEGSFFWVVNNIFFQYYSILITVACVIVMVVVSLATREPDYESISGLTFATSTKEDIAESRASWGVVDVAASILVLGGILAAYLYFRG